MSLLRAQDLRLLTLCAAVLGGAGVTYARARLGYLRTAPPVIVSSAPVSHVADTLRARETVSQLFARRGVTDVDWTTVAGVLRAFDPSRLRSGMVFTFAQRHGDSAPHAVAVRVSYDERLRLVRDRPNASWTAEVERIPWSVEVVRLSGTIRTNLYQAMDEAGGAEVLTTEARSELVYAVSEVYDWVVDFSRDVQAGDRLSVVAERMVSAEGDVRLGRVLATRLDVAGRPLYAFRFDAPDGRPEFYDERGRSMKRDLLRAPLEFKRIGSGFSLSRFHPILRYRRPHWGIDFGAAYGAPVRSVGDGTVGFAGRMGGYGNLVEVRHNRSTTTRYAHLSSFGQGIVEGAKVRQGQTVGFVGASGLATSPHLHYELRINGRAVNPRRRLAAGEGAPIASTRRQAFEGEKARLLDLLEPRAPADLRSARVDD